MWKYSKHVYDHFLNPRNVGEISDADGVGEVGSVACGDALRLSFKLDDDNKIADAKFQTFGCGSAIASSSILTEMVKGKTIDEAAQITNQDIADELGGLPREKMHCSVMGREALEAAMIDYFKKQGREIPCHLLTQGVMICQCYQVTKEAIRDSIMNNRLETVEDVTSFTKAGGGCGECHHDIKDLLTECWQKLDQEGVSRSANDVQQIAVAPPENETSEQAVERKIQALLDEDIGVALRNDGGDIELFKIDGNKVYVRLTGACAACPASEATIKGYVETQLRQLVQEDIEVIEVKF